MATISACMIVKDEEEVLRDTFEHILPYFDQIIVVDTGSTDGTLEIVNEYVQAHPDKFSLFHFKWINDFSAARNYSFMQSTCDYVTWWDADDRMSDGLKKLLLDIRADKYANYDLFNLNTVTSRYPDGSTRTCVPNERICRRDLFAGWHYRIHEKPEHYDIPGDRQISWDEYSDVTVEVFRELHDGAHLQKYYSLIYEGHHFLLHDYYWLMIMMDRNNDFTLLKWLINDLLHNLSDNDDNPWYCGLMVEFMKSSIKEEWKYMLHITEGMLLMRALDNQYAFYWAKPLLVDYYQRRGNTKMKEFWEKQ